MVFVTLWYAGVVVLWVGGMSMGSCVDIKGVMENDIRNSYTDPVKREDMMSGGHDDQDMWKVTCEPRRPVGDV